MNKTVKHSAALFQLRMATRIFAIVMILLICIGFFLPREYKIERSVLIGASSEQLSAYFKEPKNWLDWLYIENGSLVLDSIDTEDTMFDFAIEYPASDVKGHILVKELYHEKLFFAVVPKLGQHGVKNLIQWSSVDQGKLKVSWSISGRLESGLLSPYIAMFANKIAGKNFETSLQQLKKELEN